MVEVGGAGTLQRSMQSLARGGKVGLIGVLTQALNSRGPFLVEVMVEASF